MKSVLLYEFEDYDYGKDHPFKPFRGRLVYELCYRYGLLNHSWIKVIKPEPSGEEAMLSFHTKEYVDALKKADEGQFRFEMFEHGLGTSDNPVFEGIFDYSALVLGATLNVQSL
jgi:acetoin utilization protein AcuC